MVCQTWFICGFNSKKNKLFSSSDFIFFFVCDFRSNVLMQYIKMTVKSHTWDAEKNDTKQAR